MSLYQSPDNSADVNRHNINLPSFANFSNDGILISDHSGSVTCASSENSEFNNIQTKQECNSEVGFDYRSGSAFFNLFLSKNLSVNEVLDFYSGLKMVLSCPKSQTAFLEDYCNLPRHELQTFGMVLRALGEVSSISGDQGQYRCPVENDLSLKLFSLSLTYATGKWSRDKNYLDTFFMTFSSMFTRSYYQQLDYEKLSEIQEVILSKLGDFCSNDENRNLNNLYDEDALLKFGKLVGVCLNQQIARKYLIKISNKINNPSYRIELDNFTCSALEMYDSEMFKKCFAKLNSPPSEMKRDSLFSALKSNLKTETFILGVGSLGFYLGDISQVFSSISNTSFLIATFLVCKLANGIYSYKTLHKNDSWMKVRQGKTNQYDQNFISIICRTALESPDSLVEFLTFMEKPPLEHSIRMNLLTSVSLIDSAQFEPMITAYANRIYERSCSKMQHGINDLSQEICGLNNIFFLINERGVKPSLRLKSIILCASKNFRLDVSNRINDMISHM